MVSGRFISNNKTMSNKSIFIDEELHQKIKVLASMEGQSIKEWVEWVVERAYESAMRNKRPHLTKQP
jgi:predicted HicB family RNase H-like nuclease